MSVSAKDERTAQITGIAEWLNPRTKSSEVVLFATRLNGTRVTVFVSDIPHTIKLELPGPLDLERLRSELDTDVRGWLARRAFNPRNPERMTCGRTKCTQCFLNDEQLLPDGSRAPREVLTFSTQPCARDQAVAYANEENSCVMGVRIIKGRPMSGFVPRPIAYAEFLLGEAYFARRVCTELYRRIDAWGCRSADQGVRKCGVEVADVVPDTVLSFLGATHQLDRAPTPEKGAACLSGFKHLVVPQIATGEEHNSVEQEEYRITFRELQWDADEVRPAPLVLLSFDLETFGKDPATGKILMCCAVLARDNQPDVGYCITRPGASTDAVAFMAETGPVTHIAAKSELDLLLAIAKLFVDVRPDVVTGYNISGFDFPFLFGRAQALGCSPEFEKAFSRLKGHRASFAQIKRKSRQSGTRFTAYYDMPGLIVVDMMQEVRERRSLPSYKMANVALTMFVEDVYGLTARRHVEEGRFEEFAACVRSSTKNRTDPEAVIREFTKRDMHWTEIVPHHDGTAEQRGELADYCLQDAVIPLKLWRELRVADALAAKCTMCGIAPHHAGTMMQQSLLGCAFQRFCHQHRIFKAKHRQFVERDFPQGYFAQHEDEIEEEQEEEHYSDDEDSEEEEEEEEEDTLAYVPAYAGLKPPRPTVWENGVPKRDPSDKRTSKSGDFVGGYVRDPVPGLYEDPVVTLDFNSMYPSAMILHNLSPDTLMPNGWRNLEEYRNTEVVQGVMGAEWATKDSHVGIFVYILRYFMDARQVFKALVKEAPTPELRAVYSALETRCKLLANAAYGATGARSSDFSCVHAAAETTGRGSRYIRAVAERLETLEDYLVEFDGGQPELVGGDTDSVFVLLKSSRFREEGEYRVRMDRVFEAAEWLANDMNNSGLYERPMFIAVDKVSERTLIQEKKKRYIGVVRTKANLPGKIVSRGIEIVRRETLPYTKDTLVAIADMLFDVTKPVDREAIFKLVRDNAQRMLKRDSGIPLTDFVLTQGITKPLEEYRGPPTMHVELLKRMARENPLAPVPQAGDRVEFVVCEEGEKAYEKARTLEEVRAHPDKNRVDLVYCFIHRFQGPVERLLAPFCDPRDIARLLDLRRYAFDGVARGPSRGGAHASKRHLASRDMHDFFQKLPKLEDGGS